MIEAATDGAFREYLCDVTKLRSRHFSETVQKELSKIGIDRRGEGRGPQKMLKSVCGHL